MRGFTLIEMLIVVAVIGLLAAMIIPISGSVDKIKKKTRTRGELEVITSAIEAYKAKLGHYPPDNPNNPFINQLYYELNGATYTNAGTQFLTSDGGTVSTNALLRALNPPSVPNPVGGLVNFTPKIDNEEGSTVVNFIKAGFAPTQFRDDANGVRFLVSTVAWPVAMTMPPGAVGNYLCWRYNSSNPIHNSGTFDLWVDVLIAGKTNRFSNWSRDPIIVASPQP